MPSQAPSPVFSSAPVVILHQPQLAENIGAVARVMANFGLSELRLVAPRDGWPQERAWASASGASWPLDEAKVFENLEPAVADLRLTLATTARPRETELPVMTPREAAGALHEGAGAGLAGRPAVRRRAGGAGNAGHRPVPRYRHRPRGTCASAR